MILTILMVLLVLYFGLRIQGTGHINDAHWEPHQDALRFEGSGIAYIDDLHALWPPHPINALTIDLVVTTRDYQRQGFSPLLVLHDGDDQRQIAIWQYRESLIVMNGDDYTAARKLPRVSGKDIFQPNQTRYLTITANTEGGTCLYVNGNLVSQKKDWRLRLPVEGKPLRLVLGNSVYGHHGWVGDLQGVAIGGTAVSAGQVRERYRKWSVRKNYSLLKPELPDLMLKLDRQTWLQASSPATDSPLVQIPAHVVSLKKTFLALPMAYLKLNSAAMVDIVINTIGFVPLGSVLFACIGSCYGFGRRYKWIVLALCAMLSFGIELAQVWIPTRYSTLLDLILNTVGAWIGIELTAWAYRKKSTLYGKT